MGGQIDPPPPPLCLLGLIHLFFYAGFYCLASKVDICKFSAEKIKCNVQSKLHVEQYSKQRLRRGQQEGDLVGKKTKYFRIFLSKYRGFKSGLSTKGLFISRVCLQNSYFSPPPPHIKPLLRISLTFVRWSKKKVS